MLLFILWRDTTSELWTLVNFLYIAIIVYFYSLYLHSCKLLPFTTRYAQSFVHSKPVRLKTSLLVGTKYLGVLCAGSMLLLVKSYTLSVTKLVGINLWKCGSFSYWFDTPWFHN
jgi:hypothetical protein